jgi:hypothetical protein
LAKKVTWALTSDLFGSPSSVGQNLIFWTFREKSLLHQGAELPNWQNLQRNSLRGCHSQVVSIPQLLRETSGIQPHEIVQKDCTDEGTSPAADGVSYARSVKVTKAKRFFKRGKGLLCMCSNIKAFWASAKRKTHAFGQDLLFKQRQYHFQ